MTKRGMATAAWVAGDEEGDGDGGRSGGEGDDVNDDKDNNDDNDDKDNNDRDNSDDHDTTTTARAHKEMHFILNWNKRFDLLT